jgi:DNA-binding transcriptional ArsR family regulator
MRERHRAAPPTVADDTDKASRIAEILKAVAHPLRLRLVALLSKGDMEVNELADRLGAPQPIVSQQLRILRMHRLVGADRANSHATYRLLEPRLRDLVDCMEHCSLR